MAEGSSEGVARQNRGVARVLAKLNTSLSKGNFYEAHQMYRTLYFRYVGQQKFAQVEDLLYEGAVQLFNHKQTASGADLAKLYVQVLEKREDRDKHVLEEAFQRVARLYSFIPIDSPDKDAFMSHAMKWSSQVGKETTSPGHPRLHQLLAYALWTIRRYPESRQHFLHSVDGGGCAEMLVEYHEARGFQSEVDLFVAGTVLQLLCLRKHIVAAVTLKVYTEKHPSIKRGPPYKHPLLNFVWMLLLAIEHKQSIMVYSLLVEKYKPSLNRDPAYLEYLDKIGQHFFGVPAPQRPRGMFSGLFDSLFNVLNEDEDEDGGQRQPESTSTNATSTTSQLSMETEELD